MKSTLIILNLGFITILFFEPFLGFVGLLLTNLVALLLHVYKFVKENKDAVNVDNNFQKFLDRYNNFVNQLDIPNNKVSIISYSDERDFFPGLTYQVWRDNNKLIFLCKTPLFILLKI